jgi:adenylylsulfate reductase subunit A
MKNKFELIETDVLIIGGGTAGCFCALTLAENSDMNIVIAEKANIKRSGCLAAGVNALNAHINTNQTVESFVEYVKNDSNHVIREDLVYSIAKKLNKVTKKIESLGLPFLKDKSGNYVERGKHSIKINGENIKPLLADSISNHKNIKIFNNLNIFDYIKKDREIVGAVGFLINENKFVVIQSQYTVCATGGAAGIYKPNNPNHSRHKMWYCPFDTGAGYAMGIRAGAEMTSFEMRFIALRCKDTIAPTGTVAQGVKVPQVNKFGEKYLAHYSEKNTSSRLFATVQENRKGNGPCYLKTQGITKEQEDDLIKAYLNMAPSQVLSWFDNNSFPSAQNVEIEGTEPYITGGHTASGYWIDTERRTTLKNLYAIGDVAGGSPKKYVTGCFAEGEIAAESIIKNYNPSKIKFIDIKKLEQIFEEKEKFITADPKKLCYQQIEQFELSMQEVMDKYAGGISQNYEYNLSNLEIAENKINELFKESENLKASDFHELMLIQEIVDLLWVSKVLISHLMQRKETRWRCYQENLDFPQKDDKNWLKYLNSVYREEKIDVFTRELVSKDSVYEHKD